MMMDKLKAIGKKKIVLIIGGILLVIALLVLINWDRIQYRRAIAEFYGNYGNIYVMDNARVPKDIRHKYYEERFQELGKTEEEYREEAEEAYKNSGVRCKYKILRAENLIRLYKFWPDNKVHITDLEDFKDTMYTHFGKYGLDPELIKKAYVVEVKVIRDYGKGNQEATEHIIAYKYKNEWKVYMTIAYDC